MMGYNILYKNSMCFQFMQTEVWGVYVEMDMTGWNNGGRNMRWIRLTWLLWEHEAEIVS